jgi:nucleoside-diphosphate-sugar epimerase
VHREERVVRRVARGERRELRVPHAEPSREGLGRGGDGRLHLVAAQLPAVEELAAALDRGEAELGAAPDRGHALQGDRAARRRRPRRTERRGVLPVDPARDRPHADDLTAQPERPGEGDVPVALGAVVVAVREHGAQERHVPLGAAEPVDVAAPVRHEPRRGERPPLPARDVDEARAVLDLVGVHDVRRDRVEDRGELRGAGALRRHRRARRCRGRPRPRRRGPGAVQVERHRGQLGMRLGVVVVVRARVEQVQVPAEVAEELEVPRDVHASGESDDEQAHGVRTLSLPSAPPVGARVPVMEPAPSAVPSTAWDGVPVAVTGAGGFIGSHLVEALVRAGADVRALASYRSQGDLEVQRGDLRDAEAMERLVAARAVVFHLAALVAIPYSYANPRVVFDVNVTGTLNLALAARDAGVGRLVHTSTSEVYGTAQQVPITEAHPLSAQSPYAASKVAADQLVLSFHRSYELPATIVRPFNTYGPRQSMRAVLPTIAVQALEGGPVRLGSLAPRRDMTYVADTVAGFLAAAQSPAANGETLQLGTGVDHSVGDMVDAVGRAVGRPLVVEEDPARIRPSGSEVMRLISSPARMGAVTGWAPTWSLDDGVAALVAWVAAHRDAFRAGEYAV